MNDPRLYDESYPQMDESRDELRAAVVGRRIVKVETENEGRWDCAARLTLDDGSTVTIDGNADCCAWSEVKGVIERLPMADHVITDVRTDAGYEAWSILADAGVVLDLDVSWSPGSGWEGYAYGLSVRVNRTV